MDRTERDLEVLTGAGQQANYATEVNFAKRQGIFAYLDPNRSRGGSLLDDVVWLGSETLLDAGCGNGVWLANLLADARIAQGVGLDISFGMLGGAKTRLLSSAPLVEADAQLLPFPDESFDTVLAMHMLYHLPNMNLAVEEYFRVLRPGGQLLATTNSQQQTAMEFLFSQALSDVLDRPIERFLPRLTFTAENGKHLLRQNFEVVDCFIHLAAFTLPDTDPILTTLDSVRDLIDLTLDCEIDWPRVDARTTELAQSEIDLHGAFFADTNMAAFVCTKGP